MPEVPARRTASAMEVNLTISVIPSFNCGHV
jgi:hypothetical protein